MKTIYEFGLEIIGEGFDRMIGPLQRTEEEFERLEKTIEELYDPKCIDLLKLNLPGIQPGSYVTIPSKIFRSAIVIMTIYSITTEQ